MYIDTNTKLLDAAKQYASIGLQTFPCHTLENGKCSCGNAECSDIAKHPLTEHGAKDATKDDATLERYFTGDYALANIACATGDTSGVIVLDVDDPNDKRQYEIMYGKLPPTWCAETPRGGYHYYFKHTSQTKAVKNAVKFYGAMDVRATGGYVVLPPSVGANGKRYAWIVPPTDCPIATLPYSWLATLPQHDDIPPVKGERIVTIQRATTLAERVALYLSHVPPAISGQGGHAHTFSVCCRLIELFGTLTDDELLTALEAWNARCVPSWSESELRHKMTDARAKAKVSQTTQANSDPSSVDDDDTTRLTLGDDAYTGIVGDIVKAIEPQTEADNAGVLLSLLVSIGNIVGKRPTFSVGGGTHHANLFACLVGDTASGKGQAWDVARHVMKHVASDWVKDDIGYGLSSGEGLVERICDPRHEDEETIIATPSIILTLPPERRLLALETEFAKPITAMRRDGNTLSALLRSAWDGYTLEVLTRGKSRVRASNAHVSIIAHVTPDELRRLLTSSVETSNGFANRFLWCCVQSTKDLPQGGNVGVVDPFIAPLRQALDKARTIGVMTRSANAERLWNDVYPSLKHGTQKVTERARPQTLRLAMIYALAEGVSIIDERHLNAALSVWRYCEDSALALFDGDNLAIRIRSLIRQRPGAMRSELRHSVSHNIATPTFDAALRWLVQRGDVICVPCFDERQAERYYPSYWGRSGNEYRGSSADERDTSNADASVHRDTFAYHDNEPCVPKSHVPTQTENVATPTSPTSHETHTQAMTLAELLDWRNEHGIRFVLRADGVVWATDVYAERLTPAIEQAIADNQETLSFFVSDDAPAYCDVTIRDMGDTLNEDETAWERKMREEHGNAPWVEDLIQVMRENRGT